MNRSLLIAAAFVVGGFGLSGISFPAANAEMVASAALPSGELIKKKKRLKGSWEIVERDGSLYVVFGEDFRAARGPDLKVFLSPTAFADVNGKNAIRGSVNLGLLKSTRGAQEYKIPDTVKLSDYKTVLVHCEAYEVLWGGADL